MRGLLLVAVLLLPTLASAQTHWEADLTWTDNATDELGYRVEKSTAGGAYQAFPSTGPNVTAFTDVGPLSTNIEVCYKVTAFNAYGDSAPTGPLCGIPNLVPPTKGTGTGNLRFRY
jgi:hypothetical protein